MRLRRTLTGYAVDRPDGVWMVRKQFYADGPTLFTWVVRDPQGAWVGEAPTRREALELIR